MLPFVPSLRWQTQRASWEQRRLNLQQASRHWWTEQEKKWAKFREFQIRAPLDRKSLTQILKIMYFKFLILDIEQLKKHWIGTFCSFTSYSRNPFIPSALHTAQGNVFKLLVLYDQGIFTMVLSRFLLDKRVQLLIEDQKCEKKSSLDSMSIPCIYKPGPLQPLWSVLSNLYVFFCHPTVNTFCARTPAVSRQKSSHVTQHAKMDTFLNHANRCQQRLQRTSNRFVFMGSLWNVYYNCFMFGDTQT